MSKKTSKVEKFLWNKFARLIGYKRWQVNVDGLAEGRWKEFYNKEDAILYANQYKGSNYFVSLADKDKKEGVTWHETITINDPENPVKMGPSLEQMEKKNE